MTSPATFAQYAVAILMVAAVSACGNLPVQTAYNAPDGHTGQQIVAAAEHVLGAPYRYGGSSPRGFDCSGLVQFAYAQAGITVPRTSQDQLRAAEPVDLAFAQPGDVLFFRLTGRKVSHVAIYAGDNLFIHSPSSGKRVSYASLDNDYWHDHLLRVGRLY